MRIALSFLLLVGSAQAQVWEKPISPGLTYRMEVDLKTPRVIHALRLSLKNPATRAVPELGKGVVFDDSAYVGRATVTEMVAATGAIAGINADFFPFGTPPTGDPLGFMSREGELLSTPNPKRAVFAWGPASAGIGLAAFEGSLSAEGLNAIRIDAVNEECGQNQVTLNTPAAGMAISKAPCLAALVQTDSSMWAPSTTITGTVEYLLPDAQKTPVPKDKAIIVAHGNKARLLAELRPGQRVSIRLTTRGFDWEKIENAVGGGPFLVRDSKLAIDAEAQGFNASFSTTRHPRTAVGITRDLDVWFVNIDGRQTTSAGASLTETAQIMLRLGCIQAINLDGGGSTSMNLLGLTVNRPSGGTLRPVANGVVFQGPRTSTYEGTLKLLIPDKLFLDGTAQAKVFTPSGEQVPNNDIIWAATGKAWIDQGGLVRPLESGAATVYARVYGQTLLAQLIVAPKPPSDRNRSK